MIEPGWEVWSADRRRATATGEPPVGGIVVAAWPDPDPETGEVGTACRVYDPHDARLVARVLSAGELDLATAQQVDSWRLARIWRRLAADLAHGQGSRSHAFRTGPATQAEAQLAEDIVVLVRLVFGADGPMHTPPTLRPRARPDDRPAAAPMTEATRSAFCD